MFILLSSYHLLLGFYPRMCTTIGFAMKLFRLLVLQACYQVQLCVSETWTFVFAVVSTVLLKSPVSSMAVEEQPEKLPAPPQSEPTTSVVKQDTTSASPTADFVASGRVTDRWTNQGVIGVKPTTSSPSIVQPTPKSNGMAGKVACLDWRLLSCHEMVYHHARLAPRLFPSAPLLSLPLLNLR